MSKKSPQLRFEGFTDDWEQRKLGEILQIIDGDRGKNYPSSDDFLELGHTLFLSASNVTKRGFKFVNNQYISEEKSNSMGNGKVKMNDIILTSRGSIGNLALYNSDSGNKFKFLRINSGMLILRPDKFTQSSFILQSLNSQSGEKQIKLISFGSAQPQLTKKDVSNFQIQIPSAGEQIKIGDFFKQLDETITLHQRKLDLLKEQKKGYLQKMFPKNGEKVPELRFAGFADDWEQRKFKDLLDSRDGIRRGPFGSALKKDLFVKESKYVVYEQQNAIYDRFNTRYNITEEKYKELIKFKVEPDDFIMSGAGTIGRISIVPNGIKPGVFNQALIRFRLNHDKTDSKYFLQLMRSETMQRKLTESNPGSAMVNLVPMSEVKKWDILVPDISEQKLLGIFFTNFDQAIALHQRKLDLLKEQKKGFLQKMFV